jgi:transcriptional regulator with XRE-family HTH domain
MEVVMELKIGEKIAKYRKQKGYTQEQLGELVGVSGQAVSKWENGGVPDTYLLPTISKVLGVSIDALFGVEKKISDYSQDEILDDLFMFCLQKTHCKDNGIDYFKF